MIVEHTTLATHELRGRRPEVRRCVRQLKKETHSIDNEVSVPMQLKQSEQLLKRATGCRREHGSSSEANIINFPLPPKNDMGQTTQSLIPSPIPFRAFDSTSSRVVLGYDISTASDPLLKL
jgi:hypothetical protein